MNAEPWLAAVPQKYADATALQSALVNPHVPALPAASWSTPNLPVPRFGQNIWALSGLDPHSLGVRQIDFRVFDPAWSLYAREVLFFAHTSTGELRRRVPASSAWRDARSAPRSATVASKFRALRILAEAAAELDLGYPHDWTGDDTDRLRDWVVECRPESQMAWATRALHQLAPMLTLGGIRHDPMRGMTNQAWSGAPRPTLHVIGSAMSPTVFEELLGNALSYVEGYSGDIIAAWNWRKAREDAWISGDFPKRPKRLPKDHPGFAAGFRGPLQWEIEKFIQKHGALPAYTEQVGGDGERGAIAFATLAALLNNPSLTNNQTGKRYVRKRLDEGIPLRMGMLPLIVSDVRRADGTSGPWRESWCWTSTKTETAALRDAAIIVILAFTGMRAGEAALIPQRHWRTTWHGHPAVTAPLIKTSRGEPQKWWATEAVLKACQVLHATGSDDAEFLLEGLGTPQANLGRSREDTATTNAGIAIRRFIDHVNFAPSLLNQQRIGAASNYSTRQVGEGERVTPHSLRFTLASISNYAMLGDLAIKQQFKHAKLAMSWSYMSNPGTDRWRQLFVNSEMQDGLADTIELVSATWAGIGTVAGIAGHRLTREITAQLDSEDVPSIAPDGGDATTQFLGHVMDSPSLLAYVRRLTATIHFGTTNNCLYDPAKAKCGGHAEPLLAACRPEQCANTLISPAQIPLFSQERDELVNFLKMPRIPDGQRLLMTRRLADLNRHLDLHDIDTDGPGDGQQGV